MRDDVDIVVISAIVALAFSLVLVSLLGYTNVWVASVVVLALPLITIGITVVVFGIISGQRQRAAKTLDELGKQDLSERSEPGREFTQAWLGKSDYGS